MYIKCLDLCPSVGWFSWQLSSRLTSRQACADICLVDRQCGRGPVHAIMGNAIPGQLVLRGMREAGECEPEEQNAKQCSSVASALVPALTFCLDFPSWRSIKLEDEIKPFLSNLLLTKMFYYSNRKQTHRGRNRTSLWDNAVTDLAMLFWGGLWRTLELWTWIVSPVLRTLWA